MRWPLLARAAGICVLVAAVVLVAVTVGLPDRSQLRAEFGSLGVGAGFAFAGLYAAVSLSPLPKTVFTLAAGALFGLAEGLIVVLAGATVGAVAAFSLARLLGRDLVVRLVDARGARGALFDAALRRHGGRTILIARLIPVVPFTAVNYLSGVTAVRPRDFVLGTAVGIVPATAAYVTVGAYGSRPGSWPVVAALAGLALLTGAGLLTVLVRRRRARRIADHG